MSKTPNPKRDQAVAGLLTRIDWMVKNNRPSDEIAKTVEALMGLCEKYVAEDVADDFYSELLSTLS